MPVAANYQRYPDHRPSARSPGSRLAPSPFTERRIGNFTMKALALFAIVCGCLFIYGFLVAERINISTRKEQGATPFTVVITLPNVTESYRWVSVYGCSAETDSENITRCDGNWERESTQETRMDQRQYVFPWRGTPRTLVQVSAMAFDRDGKTLASGQTKVFR